ncbi:MAG: CorA family divalent cation transporter [Chloroflexota bacterium]
MGEALAERQLLWIDVDGRATADLEAVAAAVGIEPPLAARLANEPQRADLTQYQDHIHIVLEAMEAPNADDRGEENPVRHPIDIVAGRSWVLTVHDGPLRALERLDAATEGETRLGALDAAGFVAGIADEVLAGYFELVEVIEREIDELDERALRRRPRNDVLASIVSLRRRIGLIRRTLAPHRVAFAALARPEMELHEELGRPWPGLTDRLERTLDSVENLRDLLLGTFDIHMGRAAQDANEVMKVLTLLSAVLLPSVVLAGVMGMNFKLPFFDQADNFWIVVAAMVAFGGTMVIAARWRGWI